MLAAPSSTMRLSRARCRCSSLGRQQGHTEAEGQNEAKSLRGRSVGSTWTPVQTCPISNASAHELRPRRHRNIGLDWLRQKRPERGMVPAEVMTGRIPVRADTGTEFPDLLDKLVAGHRHQILINVSHWRSPSAVRFGKAGRCGKTP